MPRIAWRVQANAEGDLTERSRRRAEELANDADLRLRRPPDKPAPPPAQRPPSAVAGFRTNFTTYQWPTGHNFPLSPALSILDV